MAERMIVIKRTPWRDRFLCWNTTFRPLPYLFHRWDVLSEPEMDQFVSPQGWLGGFFRRSSAERYMETLREMDAAAEEAIRAGGGEPVTDEMLAAWENDLGGDVKEPDENDLLNAAVGVEVSMSEGYDQSQARAMCLTAWHNPEIPVAFDKRPRGRAFVVFVPEIGWAVLRE